MTRPDPHSYARSTQPSTKSIHLILKADFAAQVLHGTVTLHLEGPSDGPMDLDTRDLTILGVASQDGTAVAHTLDAADPILGARLRLTLPKHTTSVTLRYTTSPGASALQWLTPEQTAGKKHPFLFSQCQAIHARSMVPLQDSPRVRITYEAELNVPANLTAVMAAAATGHRVEKDGTTTFLFKMPQPIPSYLLALAVGNLASKELSPRSQVWAEPQVLDAAAWEFAGVEAMITAAEKLFGSYPWERFDMLVMPPSFPYGGMENPRLTFLTPTLLAGDRSLVNVVIHELAHSWTGNLVTNASLEHFWLNEGFTVYAERRLIEALEGQDAVAQHAAIGLAGLMEDMKRLGMESPHTKLRTNLTGVDPDEVYSQVPYEKGCLLLTRLEQHVGRPAFERFLAAYLARFRFQSITTDDFLACLEEELPGAAQSITIERWLDGEGLPKDAPVAKSARLDELTALAAAWSGGARPSQEVLTALNANAWQVVLSKLGALSIPDCAWLENTFALSAHGNAEIRVGFLALAARAGFQAAFPAVEKTLKTVGRMKYLRPLYGALASTAAGKTFGARVFEEAKAGYHPVARGVIANLVGAA